MQLIDDGRTIEVTGIVAEMIRWLAEHQEDVKRIPKGSVELHFAGGVALTCKTYGTFEVQPAK